MNARVKRPGHVVAHLEPVAHVALVGATLEAQVVHVEARVLVAVIGAEPRLLTANLAEAQRAGVAGEHGGVRVDVNVTGIGTLKRVDVVLLQPGDRLGRAADPRPGQHARDVEAAAEADVVVDAAGVGVLGQEVDRPA